jgi:hypothetical protein
MMEVYDTHKRVERGHDDCHVLHCREEAGEIVSGSHEKARVFEVAGREQVLR